MPKQPISVTLESENLLWLRGRAATRKRKSLSEALDEILTAARLGGVAADTPRSVVGTVDIATDDPQLERADDYIRSLFATALMRPIVARESRPSYRSEAKRKSRKVTRG